MIDIEEIFRTIYIAIGFISFIIMVAMTLYVINADDEFEKEKRSVIFVTVGKFIISILLVMGLIDIIYI